MKKVNQLALILLIIMFFLMLGSIWNSSATVDELAHIPAGFGYITQKDYRLNPEHPPLLKALAALSGQIFTRSNFPTDTKYWQEDINGQWAQGAKFLYESGNNADKIIFWSRFPLILLALFFGWLIFSWTQKRFGSNTAFLILIFYAFSPTFLAHSPLVTTDLGAAFAFFIGIITFIKFLEVPSWRNILISGIAFGAAQLIKFSLVLLVPMILLLLVSWILSRPNLHWHERFRSGLKILGKTIVIGLIGLTLIWIVYAYFVWNYPPERQLRDAEFTLTSFGFRPAVNLDLALIKNKLTRPLGQYLLGVLMVSQRSAGGNTQFFLNEVSAAGYRSYFPLLYLLKESLAFHILTLIALVFALRKILKRARMILPRQRLNLTRQWIENHFVEFSALVFIIFYWFVSIRSPLNIGVRHVLPTFPFIYLLVAKQITEWLRFHEYTTPRNWLEWLKNIYQIYIKSIPKYFVTLVLLLWIILGTLFSFPNFLSYYNELAGGARPGWQIAVDSNYDWGQDLKRLTDFVEKNKIDKIAIDYFGGGGPKYYLGEKFEPWWSARGPAHSWFAVSATLRQGAFGVLAPGFTRKPEDSYEWLRPYPPVAQIGYSIFVYRLP